ncbi:hypothetical protein [Microbacterium esteraromaticum]|uniref:hypothetical protein n=1 Tax=Microbacterium esteraromaticum TaxID=57043 RepID=UPI0019D36386|nr:hypothetical protein [Microbacterium esteraromaticum]MBN7792442.1 hypothetical protein [Microbacterium esteraromaticum]
MPAEVIVALIGGGALLVGTGGGAWLGHILASRTAARQHKTTAEHQMIDQLQEELGRYRERTDHRLDLLEAENRGYRAFIGLQRDHMAEHGIPLPPWPEGLPR